MTAISATCASANEVPNLIALQAAIKHKDESELRWADWSCRMRQQVATRKHHTQYWREMQSKVADVLREIEPSSESKNAAKGKWEHWQKFVSVETPSIRKSHKRHEAGLCSWRTRSAAKMQDELDRSAFIQARGDRVPEAAGSAARDVRLLPASRWKAARTARTAARSDAAHGAVSGADVRLTRGAE